MNRELTKKIALLLVLCLLFTTSTAFAQINWGIVDGIPNGIKVDVSNLNIPETVSNDVYLDILSTTGDSIRYVIGDPFQPFNQSFLWDLQSNDQGNLWVNGYDTLTARVTVGESVYDESAAIFSYFSIGVHIRVVEPEGSLVTVEVLDETGNVVVGSAELNAYDAQNTQQTFIGVPEEGVYRVNAIKGTGADQVVKSSDVTVTRSTRYFEDNQGNKRFDSNSNASTTFDFNPVTISGSVHELDPNNSWNLGNIRVQLRNKNTNEYLQLYSDTSGYFEGSLPVGEYDINGITFEGTYESLSQQNFLQPLEQSFSIVSDAPAETLTIIIPTVTVAGSVSFESGQSLSDINNLNLVFAKTVETTYGSSTTQISTPVINGQYNARLVEGNYTILHLRSWDNGTTTIYNIDRESVSLTAGSVLTKNVLIKNTNVQGSFKDGSTLITNARLSILPVVDGHTDYSNRFEAYTAADGTFNTYLPAGNYMLQDYSTNVNGNYSYEQVSIPFTVEAGIINTINIVLPPAVSGALNMEDGTPLSDHWINIATSDFGSHYSARTLSDGSFKVRIPDGDYKFVGYGYHDKWFSHYYEFSVVNNTATPSLNIQIKASNISGTLTKDSVPVSGGNLYIHQASNNVSNENSYHVSVDSEGNFDLFLEDGTYVVNTYHLPGTERKSIPINQTFSVVNGVADQVLSIELPTSNFTGTISMNGVPLAGAQVNIHTLDVEQNDFRWYSTYTNSMGQYDLYLPPGKYLLQGVWTRDYLEWKSIGQEINVGNTGSLQLDVDIPLDNVVGTLVGVSQAWLSVSNVDTGKWYNFPVSNEAFSTHLPDGKYRVYGYWDQATQKHIQLPYSFIVENGVSIPSSLILQPIEVSVTGTVLLDDAPVNGVWLSVRDSEGNRYQSETDASGGFELRLLEGTYTIEGYYNKANMMWISVKESFTVDSTHTTGVTPLAITIRSLAPNVFGFLQELVSMQTIANVVLQVSDEANRKFNIQVDIEGGFQTYLADGTYTVNGYWSNAHKQWVELEQSFIVSNGELTGDHVFVGRHCNGETCIDRKGVTIWTSPVTLEGFLYGENSEGISNSWVSLVRKGSDSSTERKYSIQTKSDGTFTGRLPVGEYKLLGFRTQGSNKFNPIRGVEFSISETNVADPYQLNLSTNNVKVAGNVSRNLNPVSGVWVAFVNSHGEVFMALTDVNGDYEARIPDGTYRLVGVYLGEEDGWHQDGTNTEQIRVNSTIQTVNIVMEETN
jgi:hypothetical protein